MSIIIGLVLLVIIFAMTTTILSLIQRAYSHDGKLIIEKDEESGKTTFTLEVDIDPLEIEHMKNVSFKVVTQNKHTL